MTKTPFTTPEFDNLLKQFDLEQLDQDLFLGDPGKGEGRLFGGMVAAQSVIAGYRTIEERSIHSFHAYFLRPGRHGVPIRFVVSRIRDGRSFATRDVVAYQAGEAIFQASLSFMAPEESVEEHQEPMPEDVPPPEECGPWQFPKSDRRTEKERPRWQLKPPIAVREADPDHVLRNLETPQRQVWLRMRGTLPEDEVIHAASIAYGSDMGLLSTARGVFSESRMTASLDHSVWFHHPPRFDDWLLYTSRSPIARSTRALIYGELYRRDGTRAASVVQEGLIRRVRKQEPNSQAARTKA